MIALFLAGAVAFRLLPVAPLPQIDFPTISVGAGLPGASPEIMASSVATPLERQFGRIAAVSENDLFILPGKRWRHLTVQFGPQH